jgi:quinol monooxygenase YgiN
MSPRVIILAIGLLAVAATNSAGAQERKPMVRIARIVVDSARLTEYRAALKQGIETAVSIEPGVLTILAVYDKDQPTHVTVMEIYADEAACHAHLQTPHFIKYKETTKDMVKSLELVDAIPIGLASKPPGDLSH